jgi:prevent-host-death family protein
VQSVYFESVTATLTELRRDTSNVIRPAIHAGETVVLTEHGEPCAQIVPVRKIDRQQALEDLRAIGPVEFPPRQ